MKKIKDIKFFIGVANAKRMLYAVFAWAWWCKLWKWHDWTTLVERGEPPVLPKEPTTFALRMSFYNHCKMTCKRCGTEAEPSKRFYNQIINDYAEVRN